MRESQQLRSSAKRDAEDLRAAVRAESDEMLEAAETRSRDLARSAESIWRERRRLIDDMRGIGEQLVAIGDVEGKRFAKLADEIPVAAQQPAHAARNGEPAGLRNRDHGGRPALGLALRSYGAWGLAPNCSMPITGRSACSRSGPENALRKKSPPRALPIAAMMMPWSSDR